MLANHVGQRGWQGCEWVRQRRVQWAGLQAARQNRGEANTVTLESDGLVVKEGNFN
jgi:hypothetical protein